MFVKIVASALIVISFTQMSKTEVRAAQIDCETLLCLAGGFPGAACQPPYQYMLSRIRQKPPKPPFGNCEHVQGATSFFRTRENPPLCLTTVWTRSGDSDTREVCTAWEVTTDTYIQFRIPQDNQAPLQFEHVLWSTKDVRSPGDNTR